MQSFYSYHGLQQLNLFKLSFRLFSASSQGSANVRKAAKLRYWASFLASLSFTFVWLGITLIESVFGDMYSLDIPLKGNCSLVTVRGRGGGRGLKALIPDLDSLTINVTAHDANLASAHLTSILVLKNCNVFVPVFLRACGGFQGAYRPWKPWKSLIFKNRFQGLERALKIAKKIKETHIIIITIANVLWIPPTGRTFPDRGGFQKVNYTDSTWIRDTRERERERERENYRSIWKFW